MTDEELIAYLRLQGLDKDIAAADRIEALIAERDEAFGEWDKAIVLAEKAAALMNEMDTRRIAAEAKLEKVVEALEYYAVEAMPWDADDSLIARTALAEIKKEKTK